MIRELEETDKHGKVQWECQCDCGNKHVTTTSSLTSNKVTSCGCKRKESHNAIDMVGKKIHMLTVIENVKTDKPFKMWRCRCDCGNETIVKGNSLRTGNTKSCGCLTKSIGGIDLTGRRFERLVVKERYSKSKPKFIKWVCECDCGNITIVSGNSLKMGTTKSCGCLQKENARKLAEQFSGENSPRWNPNLTNDERGKGRKIKGYGKWKKSILNRDQHKCQLCDSAENLNVHHIYSYKEYPKLRTNIHNGIVLCNHCHKDYHKIYGYTNVHLFDFLLYFSDILQKRRDIVDMSKKLNHEFRKFYPNRSDGLMYFANKNKLYKTIEILQDDVLLHHLSGEVFGYKGDALATTYNDEKEIICKSELHNYIEVKIETQPTETNPTPFVDEYVKQLCEMSNLNQEETDEYIEGKNEGWAYKKS